MTSTVTAPTPAPTYELVAPSKIGDFPLNPREHWGNMEELEASIKAQGVLEPILVRRAGDRFQVIAGARRLRAARAAGLGVIPTIVREATDAQALEIALVENGNRQDVHRLNEAIALDGLMKLDKTYTPAVLAAHLGRPEKYVRETLKLLALVPAARKAYADDRITAGHAVVLSRLPADRQGEGLEACFSKLWNGSSNEPVLRSVKALEAWVKDSIPLELASPSPETRELFPEAVKLASTGTAIVQVHKAYGDLKRKGSKETILGSEHWKKAAGRDECARAGVVVLGDDRGEVLRVCTDQDCAKHWPKAKAQRSASTTTRRSPAQVKKDKAAAARAEAKRALETRTIAALIKAAAETVTKVDLELLRTMFEAEVLFNVELPSDEVAAVFAEMTGLKAARYGQVTGKVEEMTERQIARGIVVSLLTHNAYRVKDVAKAVGRYKVKAAAVVAEVERQAKAEAKAAAAAAKPAAKKKAGQK